MAASHLPTKPSVPRRTIASGLLGDALAGVTLAAITIPEQMATAKLGGFEPQIGFYAFIGATVGFALLGANRILTAGADSTITPIFTASLALLATSGTASLASASVTLALLLAAALIAAGILRLGWIADLLSTPIVTGFLAGIAAHIVVSQLPDALGVPSQAGNIFDQLHGLSAHIADINPWSVAIAAVVLATALATEVINPRLPGALIAVAVATLAAQFFSLDAKGVAVLGHLPAGLPEPVVPAWDLDSLRQLVPLALILALVVMMQTAAVTRSFADSNGEPTDVNRDFIGVGAANLCAALLGAFPVNASPPRTAVVRAAGGTSQLGAMISAGLVAALALGGGGLMRDVPEAALAGVLLFVAVRIVRVPVINAVARQAPVEFALILLTAIAVIALPIPTGVAIGIGLSLLHGVWISTQTRVSEFKNVPGTTIWWPENGVTGESTPGVLVVGFQAPLLFANAETFRRGIHDIIAARQPLSLVVLEGGAIADIDYTAAQALRSVMEECRARHIQFAIARLVSVRAQAALQQFGILSELGPDKVFHSVAEAISALQK
ncbi:Sulfate permease, MFS superfamily [Enhydrobacter aerosaccus]|uniref:Sulfate permease, MFS superfamily n=1 Tax=Enhydrobacter aerosaccus TaxID=225324 RepID=A0A1T4T0T8_9HYPH|nr:SulP family inorganic anion transporter [Enhydrobacter aerosaccus]SKA34027.1 Sulfate permease, MFS superfamily [Enhydrobacter aerosaccus]